LASLCPPSNAGSSGAEKPGRLPQGRALVPLLGRAWLWKKPSLPSFGPTPTSPLKSTASYSKRLTAFVSLRPASAGRLSDSVCRLKKDTLRFRARRKGARALARAGRANRPKAARFRGRMRDPYFHDSPLRASSKRPASIRQHPQKPGQEHNPTCKPLLGGHRGGYGRGGIYDPQGL
jgi:hypothetical protein